MHNNTKRWHHSFVVVYLLSAIKPCGFSHMFAVPFVLRNVLSSSFVPTNKNLLLHILLSGSRKVKILIKLYDSVNTHMDTMWLRQKDRDERRGIRRTAHHNCNHTPSNRKSCSQGSPPSWFIWNYVCRFHNKIWKINPAERLRCIIQVNSLKYLPYY